MRIKYISFYDVKEYDKEKRVCFPSTINKANYICDVLNRNGVSVDIISSAWTKNRTGFYRSRALDLSEFNKLYVSPAFGVVWSKLIVIQKLFTWLWLMLYIIKNTKQEETIIVYHGINKIIPLLFLKKIKKLHYILEVEEIFSSLSTFRVWKTKLEMKMIRSADKYIFASKYLNKQVNLQNKPYCIINGNYKVEKVISEGFNDHKVHIVYAGIINSKKGAFTSVELAKFLPNSYHIHILGFGDVDEINKLIEHIKKNNNHNYACISYDGLICGKKYTEFLQKCDIGLCPQIADEKYNSFSFPSKISSYLSNGLRVVVSRSSAIEDSPLSSLLFFSDDDTPQQISKTILGIDLQSNYNSREVISQLDKQVVKCVKYLIDY